MNTFAVSDMHYFHANILRYCHRPFATVEDQTQGLIANWNGVVGNTDRVINLGDYIWTKDADQWVEIVNACNGTQRIIVGNHDHLIADRNGCAKRYQDLPAVIRALLDNGKLEWIKNYHEEKINGRWFVFHHFPIGSWHRQMHGAIMSHGHTHATYPASYPKSKSHGKILDCGVDAFDYTPVSIERIIALTDTFTTDNCHSFEN